MGVEPTGERWCDQPVDSDLVDRIRARAAEIRQSWQEGDDSLGDADFPVDDVDTRTTDNADKEPVPAAARKQARDADSSASTLTPDTPCTTAE